MMELYYDWKKQEWSSQENTTVTMGITNKVIPFSSGLPENKISFPVKKIGNKVGPVVGIFTSKSKKSLIGGNATLFQELSKTVSKRGGIVIVFSEDGLYQDEIYGYTFLPDFDRWLKVRTPLPDIIYNRIPFRSHEKRASIETAKKLLKKKGIPFFNPHFFPKWDIYTCLKNNRRLVPFLPYTIKWDDIASLKGMLEYDEIYMKPVNGYKGTGIFLVNRMPKGYLVQTHKASSSFSSFDSMLAYIKKLKGNRDYIIQERIPLTLFDSRPYDYRILAHFTKNKWRLSGIGVRHARESGITTHVPKGGEILPVTKVGIDKALVQQIVTELGTTLRKAYGNIRELSLDLGKSNKNHYYILEVNAKPMKFDEAVIEQKRLVVLADIFDEESGFLSN
jgi:glutathione synthase/RimK-type ligase-like ATP-grasp enzyme